MTAAAGAAVGRGASTKAGSSAVTGVQVADAIGQRKRKTPAKRGKAQFGRQQVLLAELVICVLLVGLHPLSRKEGEVTPGEWIKRATAVSFLFMLLGMLGAVGPKAQKAANAFGGLIALVLLIDQRSIFALIAEKLSAEPKPPEETPGTAIGGLDA